MARNAIAAKSAVANGNPHTQVLLMVLRRLLSKYLECGYVEV